MTIQAFYKGMKEHFDIMNPGVFLDDLHLLQKRVKINLLKFDEWLHEEVGEYEEQSMNMGDALTYYYSPEASYFVESLL